MQQNTDSTKQSTAEGGLKPCRSSYCECDSGKCTHPGFYDARAEPQMARVRREDPAQVASDVRAACEKLRRTPVPLIHMVPLLRRAAEALHESAPEVAADVRALCDRLPTALSEMIPVMQRAADALDGCVQQ